MTCFTMSRVYFFLKYVIGINLCIDNLFYYKNTQKYIWVLECTKYHQKQPSYAIEKKTTIIDAQSSSIE